MTDVAMLLREARQSAGFTQAELAARVGTSQPAINRYEHGGVEPSISTLRRILHACGLRLEFDVRPEPTVNRSLHELLQRQRNRVVELAGRHGATNVRVFGSVARGEETLDSDIDLLVDLEPGHTILDLVGLRRELTEALGVPVDVTTIGMLKKHLRPGILAQAIPL